MAGNLYAGFALVVAAAAFLYFLLHQWRYNNFANIPSPLPRSLFLGHLGYLAAGFKKAEDSKIHPGWSAHFPCVLHLTTYKTTSSRTSGKNKDVRNTCSSTSVPPVIQWL
jgi:hypothetical protein